MKMKGKICLTLAIAMMLSTALTACSGDNGNASSGTSSTSGSSETSSVETTTGDDGRPMEGNLYLEGLPLVKEQETFSIFCDGGDVEKIIMLPILEEQTNVKLDVMAFPYETALEKKNILLNSGDYPDMFGGWILGDKDIMTTGAKEEVFIPLEDLMAKYSPKMTEILEREGVRTTMTLPNGHIYSIPYVIGEPKVTFAPVINQKWLDNLDLEMPKTTDELYEVLKAFKAQDANGNGDPNDEIPFSGDPVNLSLGTFAGWWGVNASDSGINVFCSMNEEGKLDFMANKDGFKEMIKYFSKLYKEGLVDPELFTQDAAQWKAKGNQDLYGVSMCYGAGDFAKGEDDAGIPVEDQMWPEYFNRTVYEPLPVLQADSSIEPVWRRNGYGVTTFRTQLVITDAAENPATIIRWWDNVFQPDNSFQIQAGIFDIRLKKLGELDYQYMDETKLSEEDREKYGWGNMFLQSLPKYCPPEIVVKPAESEYKEYKEKDVIDALYEPYLDENPPKVWYSDDDSKRLSILETDIKEYVKKKIAEWVTGQKDVESDWETYLKELESFGVNEYVQIRAAAAEAALAQ